MANNDQSSYRGKRALVLTRVSTVKQEEKYSHAAQERTVREKLIEPLGLYVVNIIHDTYSGLEYRYRKALDDILALAEDGAFDLLCMDVLDRGLGRRALARELFRMQLQEFGIRILTTEPSDHADDDTLEGQIMRFHKGIKAEEEINDLVRRTKAGKREKALGNPEKGIPPQIVGVGRRRYGYEYIRNEKGVSIGYKLRIDVIHVEPDGTEWTEVKVVTFIFESAANGMPLGQIALALNAKGIPTPLLSKGERNKRMKEEPVWQRNTLSRLVKDTGFYGEDRYNKTASSGRVSGRKRALSRQTSEEEQIIVPIPPIVTRQLWEKANRRVAANKPLALCNNKCAKESLVRGGIARCANCGGTLRPCKQTITLASGEKSTYYYYNCPKPLLKKGRCPGCSIPVDLLDAVVAEYILEVIRDPSEVDLNIQQLLAESPMSKQQQRKLRDLNKILRDKETLRNNLAAEMLKKTLSEQTIAFLGTQLAGLEQQEQEARRDLADQQRVQQQYENLDRRIAEFHQQCQEWRKKINDPQFTPDFHFNHEAVIFFGINVKVWRPDAKPRYQIYTRPREIVELLS